MRSVSKCRRAARDKAPGVWVSSSPLTKHVRYCRLSTRQLLLESSIVCRGVVAGEGRGIVSSPKFSPVWHFFRPKIFLQNTTYILGWKSPILGKFRGKIDILHLEQPYLLCRKFAAVCRKVATSRSPTFFSPRRRWSSDIVYPGLGV